MSMDPIVRETHIAADPAHVYAAYADIDELRKWFAHGGHMDARPNGTWRFEWPGGMAAEGRVLEAISPTRFVWTWEKSIGPDADGNESVMESMVTNVYTFEPDGDGTLFRIEESGHDSEEIRDVSAPGIDAMLGTLRDYLESGVVVDWSNVSMPASEFDK